MSGKGERLRSELANVGIVSAVGTPVSLILRGRKARVYGSEENVNEVEGHPSEVHRGVQE